MRTAPKGSESRCSSTPSAESASSSEPPPMSITTARPTPISKWASALRKESIASCSPSSNRTRSPVSSRTCARNCAPLRASRTALVATASTRWAPSCRARVFMRERASMAARMAVPDSSPVSSSPAPSRGAAFSSSMTRMAPVGDTSATIARMELEPMSIAPMRTSPLALGAAAGVTGAMSPVDAELRPLAVFAVVLDLLPFREIDSVFSDVRREIRDPLQVPADEQELERGRDRPWVGQHVRQQDAENRVVKRVHLVVRATDVTSQLPVGPHEGIQGIGKHLARSPHHVLDLRCRRDVRLRGDEALRRLRDVDGVVADAFQVARHLDGAHEEPEVARHRLLEGEEPDGPFLDVQLEEVDLAIAADHRLRLRGVMRQQRIHGEVDERLGLLGHGEQLRLEDGELVVKMAKAAHRFWGRAHPNLPVM